MYVYIYMYDMYQDILSLCANHSTRSSSTQTCRETLLDDAATRYLSLSVVQLPFLCLSVSFSRPCLLHLVFPSCHHYHHHHHHHHQVCPDVLWEVLEVWAGPSGSPRHYYVLVGGLDCFLFLHIFIQRFNYLICYRPY